MDKIKYFKGTRLLRKSLVFYKIKGFNIVLLRIFRYNENIRLFSYLLQKKYLKIKKIYKK